MFNGFNQATMKYFNKITMNNTKANYEENKALYYEGVSEPLEQLYIELSGFFYSIDSDLTTSKRRCISSPFNDARFCRDNPIKEYFYLRFRVNKERRENIVGFYFDASLDGYKYGLNIYHLNSNGMGKIRECIISDKTNAQKIIRHFNRVGLMEMSGVKYKKESFMEYDKTLREWLNMLTITFAHQEKINPRFFDRRIYEDMLNAYRETIDLYKFIKLALE